MEDQKRRKQNIILTGVRESVGNPFSLAQDALDSIREKSCQKIPKILHCFRIGQESDGKIRPIKLVLKSDFDATTVLSRAHLLRNIDGYNGVYISPVRTPAEREKHAILVKKLKEKIKEDRNMFWFIRNGEVHSREHCERVDSYGSSFSNMEYKPVRSERLELNHDSEYLFAREIAD